MSDYCSQASIATESPLYGTAGNDQRWLLLEYNGAWQAKAIQDNTLPPAVADWFRTQAAAIGARPQFIKRATPYRDEWIRLYVVDTDPSDPKLLPWHFKSYDEMLDLDVTELLNAGLESSQEQLLLICTNGKRDNCCAKFGLPIYNALAQEDGLSVWQTTHTGGHRYAATGISLPSGVVYGYLTPSNVADVAAAIKGSAIHLATYRGRSHYAEAVSAADYFVRRQVGNSKVGGIGLISAETTNDLWTINFAEGDRTHIVTLTQSITEPELASCNGKKKPRKQFDLVSFTTT